jgi:septal ring factor EnvC (AmiA/AmiB activator)
MAQILEDAIVASNLPGFDYLEFRDALVNMKDLPLPEAQKFQAVFATAQSMKVDKGKLLEAIDHYLKVVEKSSADFKAYIDGVTEKEVTSKSGTVDRLDQEMQKNAAEIQRLTQVVQELKKQQDAVRMEVAQAELEISNKKAAFEATQAAVTQNLTSDRSKIETYLV